MPNHIYILAAIDGTGSRAEHARLAALNLPTRTRRSSNVLEFYYDFRTSPLYKKFFEGPDSAMFGVDGEVSAILHNVVRFVREAYQSAGHELTQARREAGDQIRICLVGHSRGGLIAVLASHQIHRELNKNIYFLGLYDAVDRSMGYDGSMIHYVDHTFHAVRDSYELDAPNYLFGNTGTVSSGNYSFNLLDETHGVIGWTGSSVANSWIRSNARRLELPIS